MHIRSFQPQIPTAMPVQAFKQSQSEIAPKPQQDSFESEASGKKERSLGDKALRVGKMALPIAAGVYAGLSTGVLAGVAGAAALAPACALIGSLGGGVIGEKVLGTTEEATAGALLIGGIGGLAAGLIGGGYLGSQVASPALAVGLGLAGALNAGWMLLTDQ